MPIHDFSTGKLSVVDYGGKANTLAQLTQAGFPVPAAVAISQPPDDEEWRALIAWWDTQAQGPLAVRSSACGEDGADLSFAGQHETLLNVTTADALREAIATCFASTETHHARSYRAEMGLADDDIRMNVVIQCMVQPKYAGVYFSKDPSGATAGCLIEYVEGLGEDLVSGRVTPSRIAEADLETPVASEFVGVRDWGRKAGALLDYPLDMEWAIDAEGGVHILQCRPITTESGTGADVVSKQIATLKQAHSPETLWDGQPFAEWPGQASPAGHSLWARAFSKDHAFDSAIRRLGYRGCKAEGSLLDRVLGRPYVNLERLMPCFYGPLPCRMVADPEPRLTFNAGALSVPSLLNLPGAVFAMLRVAGRMSSSRTEMLKECRTALTEYQARLARMPAVTDGDSPADIAERLQREFETLTRTDFVWPLALIMLVQSTTKTLEAHLTKTEPAGSAATTLQEWMSVGLHTATMQMHRGQQAAAGNPEAEAHFLETYGHRGPGELDIASPRWSEMGNALFASAGVNAAAPSESVPPENASSAASGIVANHIDGIKSVRKTLIAQEWDLLRDMLELREEWKMALMKAFSLIRTYVLALAQSSGVGNDIFQLTLDEMIENAPKGLHADGITALISERNAIATGLAGISLPEVLSLSALEDIVSGKSVSGEPIQQGVALSPGLAEGEVRVVMGNPADVDLSSWPENVILVTESTDPGWTPLFARVRGIVVEKGGVLSHCAIVAREMHIPAVSQIQHCYRHFKDGDRLWVDGLKGTVRTQSND